MTEYEIVGEKIIVSTEVENERQIEISTARLIEQVGSIFDKWYDAQYNCRALWETYDAVIDEAIEPIIEKAVSILGEQGVYTINSGLFVDKYFENGYDVFFRALRAMEKEIDEIDGQKQLEKEYRQARKDGRGRVVGGGFGLGGAIKGMATAGVMNATTGMVHSLGNAVGNMGSSIAASASKSAVYRESKETLRDALIEVAYNVIDALRKALEREANIKCKCVTETEAKQSEAIRQNYLQGRIPKDKKREQLVQALLLNPYHEGLYLLIWKEFGDKNGDLRKMSVFFGCSLENIIKSTAEKYGRKTYAQNCGEYLNAFNKSQVAIKCEDSFKRTVKELKEFCDSHDIEENLIPEIQECENILRHIDEELSTVHGVKYNSRETAEKIKMDYVTFYGILDNRKTLDEATRKEVFQEHYRSEDFPKLLDSLWEKECKYRNPELIFESIKEIVEKNIAQNIISAGWIDIPGIIGKLEQKENAVKTIASIKENEVALILFDRSGNGKSGILLTNEMLHIYSKGIFSNENKSFEIDKIKQVECVDADEYMISFVDSDAINISLKHKDLTVDEQINVGKTISKLILLVKNLSVSNRTLIYRIANSIAVCECGTHLVHGEVICPSCRKMRCENGEFVETEICLSCNSVIPKGKKFCSKCGSPVGVKPEPVVTLDDESICCPKCQKVMKKGKKFCSACGTKI
ncbi:MAG: zinc ribbon domain-containing protein [Lachnospiraceae bacterium]|nr:zinc ribbon domain-containing protein [Lachnospiraceae bacterium]